MATTKFSTGKMREFINMVDVCKMYGIQPFHVPKDLELLMDHALRVNSISVGALQQLLTELATEVKNMQRGSRTVATMRSHRGVTEEDVVYYLALKHAD